MVFFLERSLACLEGERINWLRYSLDEDGKVIFKTHTIYW